MREPTPPNALENEALPLLDGMYDFVSQNTSSSRLIRRWSSPDYLFHSYPPDDEEDLECTDGLILLTALFFAVFVIGLMFVYWSIQGD